jgi:prepilin-type N-terminal cleavage/methylation domain-containing protein
MTFMKTPASFHNRKGFTLMELMVAMAITVIIVTVLVSITSIAIETWNRSRSELRAARQAKSMVDTMARDFEAFVSRPGNDYEWLAIDAAKTASTGDSPLPSTNASELIFFTAATDRYKGDIGTANDLGGDVSCVGYQLFWKDPIDQSGTAFKTFVLNRLLVDPKPAFDQLLGKTDLAGAFGNLGGNLEKTENFVCENVFQFTIMFHVEVLKKTGSGASATQTPVTVIVPVGKGSTQTAASFKVRGNGIVTPYSGNSNVTADELKAGRLAAIEISLTVLSDAGVDQLRRRGFSGNQQSEFMAKHSYQYSKLVQVPGM